MDGGKVRLISGKYRINGGNVSWIKGTYKMDGGKSKTNKRKI